MGRNSPNTGYIIPDTLSSFVSLQSHGPSWNFVTFEIQLSWHASLTRMIISKYANEGQN